MGGGEDRFVPDRVPSQPQAEGDGPRGLPRDRRVLIFIVIACALMMMSIDATIVATALHALASDLDAPINWTGWTITAYWFGYVVMLPVSGRLAERFGHRRVFIASTLAFALASLACALAQHVALLVFFRALQAIGGAGLTPAATGIVVAWFGASRDRVLGLFGAVFSVGALIGPVFGGLFVTYASWRDVFFVNVPIGLAMALLGLWLIPPDRAEECSRRRMDVPGMLLLGVAVIAGMLAASVLGNTGVRVLSWPFLAPLGLALLAGWAFFRHIARVAEPFLPPRLIHGPGFAATNFLNATYGGVISGAVTLVPLYAATRYGLSALDAATLLVAQGVVAFILGPLAAWALRWSGYRWPFYVGGVLAGLGALLLALKPRLGLSPWAWLALASVFMGASGGVMGPASRNAALQLVPDRAATMSALRATAQELGVIIVLAVLTSAMAMGTDAAQVLAMSYALLALLSLALLPVVARVPEHRGAW